MAISANQLRWKGRPGHYEVYYLTLTDPDTGVGIWIRYSLLAPDGAAVEPATCAVWFAVMDPRPGGAGVLARRAAFPIEQLRSQAEPFELRVADAILTDGAMAGELDEFRWDLRWSPSMRPYEPINPALGRLGLARTVFVIPHADVVIDGVIEIGAQRLELAGSRGGQAHLWGSEHAESWAWARCNDLQSPEGASVPGSFFDGVSAMVTRFGRTLGPNTPIVGCFAGRPFNSTSPRRILTNDSRFDLEGWRFEAVDGPRRMTAHVRPVRDQLAGVTYHDPDGRPAYCYNSETASVQIEVHQRAGREWHLAEELSSAGRCHFEFGTRTPVPGIELSIT
jgi:hypothetical protein